MPDPGTVGRGEPQHPKESEPRQVCLRCCGHLHSFGGDQRYNDIKVKHKILNYGACALLREVKPGLTKSKLIPGCALCHDKPTIC